MVLMNREQLYDIDIVLYKGKLVANIYAGETHIGLAFGKNESELTYQVNSIIDWWENGHS